MPGWPVSSGNFPAAVIRWEGARDVWTKLTAKVVTQPLYLPYFFFFVSSSSSSFRSSCHHSFLGQFFMAHKARDFFFSLLFVVRFNSSSSIQSKVYFAEQCCPQIPNRWMQAQTSTTQQLQAQRQKNRSKMVPVLNTYRPFLSPFSYSLTVSFMHIIHASSICLPFLSLPVP